jgi:hypothetical protein
VSRHGLAIASCHTDAMFASVDRVTAVSPGPTRDRA